jgi:hypothetical protein
VFNKKRKPMKKRFVLLIALVALLAGGAWYEGKAQVPDSSLKLICPNEPEKGFFNPDSVLVDTCNYPFHFDTEALSVNQYSPKI